jgi:hypothetical protein
LEHQVQTSDRVLVQELVDPLPINHRLGQMLWRTNDAGEHYPPVVRALLVRASTQPS